MFDESYGIGGFTSLLEKAEDDKLGASEIKQKIKTKNVLLPDAKKFVRNIYRIPGDSIAAELPTIGGIIRKVILVGGASIANPFLGIFVYIADKAVEDSVNAKTINGYIMQYTNLERKAQEAYDADDSEVNKEHLEDVTRGLDKLKDRARELKVDYKDNTISGTVKELAGEFEKEINESFDTLMVEINILSEYQFSAIMEDDEILAENMASAVKDKAKDVARDVAMKAKSTKQDADRKMDMMDKWFDDTHKEIRGDVRSKERDTIIQNSLPKLSKMIKRAAVLGVSWAVNPVIAAIGLFATLARDKKINTKERQRLMNEINREIEIVDEKVRDADSAGEKKKKYQLMRLKHKLTTEKDRIKRLLVFDKKSGDTKGV